MKKYSLILSGVIGGAVLVGGAGYAFLMPQTAALDTVAIRNVSVTTTEIRVIADFAGSSMRYAGHQAEVKEDALVIEILMRNGFALGETRPPEFSIKNEYPELKAIYLKGSSPNETRLIWSR